jgi:hypothetical protein
MFAVMVRRSNLIRSKESGKKVEMYWSQLFAIGWLLMGVHVECMEMFI